MPLLILFTLMLIIPCWLGIKGSKPARYVCSTLFAISSIFYSVMFIGNINNLTSVYFLGMLILSMILAGLFINGIKKKNMVNK